MKPLILLLPLALLISQNAANPANPFSMVAGGFKALGEASSAITSGAKTTFGGLTNSLTGGISEVLQGVGGATKDLMQGNLVGAVTHGTEGFVKGVTGTVGGSISSIASGVGEVGDGVIHSVGTVTAAVLGQETPLRLTAADTAVNPKTTRMENAIEILKRGFKTIIDDVKVVIKYGPTATVQLGAVFIRAFVVATGYVVDTILRNTIGVEATIGVEQIVNNSFGKVWSQLDPNLPTLLYPVALLLLPVGIVLTVLLSGIVTLISAARALFG